MYIAFISNTDCPNRLSFDGHPSTSKFLLLQIKKKQTNLKAPKNNVFGLILIIVGMYVQK